MPTKKQMENLKKGKATQFRTGEEQARIAKMGGIASGEARRQLKTFRELDTEHTTDDEREKMLNALKKRAINGDLRAFEVYRDTMGMNPKDRTGIVTEYADDGLADALKKAAEGVWGDE